MSVKPILFNTGMVRAILDGRKTVTRRLVKHDVNEILNSQYHKEHPEVDDKQIISKLCMPPCQPGDILYVRESVFQGVGHYLDVSGETVSVLTHDFEYYADGLHEKDHWKDKYERTWMHRRPSIHMPKEAARIWLKVKDVRVERLKDMTDKDALREGAQGVKCDHTGLGAYGCTDCMNTGWLEPPILEFIGIWNSTIKKSDLDRYGWEANPYVFVIEFMKIDNPEEI